MMTLLGSLAVYAISLTALTWGGNHICRLVLKWSGLLPAASKPPAEPADALPAPPVSGSHAGRWIGSLERLLIMLGLAANSWEVMVAVIALKTVARYQELDKRTEAEYFLVGSLASMLWAVLVTALTLHFDRTYGLHISSAILAIRASP